jgi:hypothetical protein
MTFKSEILSYMYELLILNYLVMKTTGYQSSANEDLKTTYQCPMKCEGEKTYDQPGNCPVCNMKLLPTGDAHQHHH